MRRSSVGLSRGWRSTWLALDKLDKASHKLRMAATRVKVSGRVLQNQMPRERYGIEHFQ